MLCSGGGTNLQALIDAVEAGTIDGQIVLVLANASKAFALERAKKHGIPAEFVSKKQAGSDEAFNDIILQKLKAADADLVVLAIGIRQLSPREVTGNFGSVAGRVATQPMPFTDVPVFTGTTGSNIMKTMLPFLKQQMGV